jgi:DNA-binding Xre family transcriptional regulator
MVTKWKVVPFVFNTSKFAQAIRLHTLGKSDAFVSELAGVAGVSATTIGKMCSGLEDNCKMQTFLGICNALDLNPLDYIELDNA